MACTWIEAQGAGECRRAQVKPVTHIRHDTLPASPLPAAVHSYTVSVSRLGTPEPVLLRRQGAGVRPLADHGLDQIAGELFAGSVSEIQCPRRPAGRRQ